MRPSTSGFTTLALASALALTGVGETSAQSTELGFRGGAAFSDVTSETIDTETRTGFTAGVFFEFPLSEYFSIEPGANYVQRGGDFEEPEVTSELQLSYVEIPVLFKANIVNDSRLTPHLYAGPTVSVEIECTFRIDDEEIPGPGTEGGCDEEQADFATQSATVGLMAGGGVDFALGETTDLALDVLYNAGLTDLSDDEGETNPFLNVKNRTLTVTAALSFPLGGGR